MKKTIAIITSDPKSINFEILRKSLFFFKKKNKNKYLFIGSKKLLKKNLKKIKELDIENINWISEKKKKIYIKESFEKFASLFKEKKVHGLINLPLNKKKSLNNCYPGVTEYLAKLFKCKANVTMLLYNNKFSVSPITTHLPIKKISHNIKKKKIIKNFENIYNFYKNFLKINKPIIGILGLNPHNAQDFKKKFEEEKLIIPTIKKLKLKYKNKIKGPLSPDTSFLTREEKKINCLIGMYHDQILTTFKYIHKFSAINITLGLPFLRISPDHGTGEKIIGKNRANPDSFLYALNFFEQNYKSI